MSDEQRPNLDWYEEQIKKCKEVIRKQNIEIHDAKTELAELKLHHHPEQPSGEGDDLVLFYRNDFQLNEFIKIYGSRLKYIRSEKLPTSPAQDVDENK